LISPATPSAPSPANAPMSAPAAAPGAVSLPPRSLPAPSAVLELLKPVTWFAPMWALACGAISSGAPLTSRWPQILGAVLLAGPLVCGTSQAANDWFDRHVDRINEPNRPIPSGRVPGRWGLYIAIAWTALSLLVARALGTWVFAAAVVGLALAWAYSAPPLRLKLNGWYGNTAVGLCYEGLPWFTGAAALAGHLPDGRSIGLAGLYSLGAFGIMVLNDFKAIEGDRQLGVRTLPVQLGVLPAVLLACAVMALPQVAVVSLLFSERRPIEAAIVLALLVGQLLLMPALVRSPRERAPRYNATGTTLYVLGMMASAFAVRALLAAGR
jgi:chlorophyll/bacteriochlorophyll a synthase